MKRRAVLPFIIAALVAATSRARAQQSAPATPMTLEIPSKRSGLAWAKINDDASEDLVLTDATQFQIYYGQPGGGYSDAKKEILPDPYGGALYDLSDLDHDGMTDIIMLHSTGVDDWQYDKATGKIVKKRALLEGLRGLAPEHLAPADFLFDVDNDGDEDIVYPVDGKYYIFFQDKGTFSKSNQVTSRPVKVEMEVGEPLLRKRISASMEIPRLAFEDINGDGRLDLRATRNNRESFYIQNAEGIIPEQPTYEVDLEKFKSQAPKQTGAVKIDQFQFIPSDLNGDGKQDYVIVAGNKIWVFLAGPQGVDFTKPAQILKVSAEYMTVVLLPLNDDKQPDLLILKYAVPSLGRIVAGLAIGLRFEVEFLGYNNVKGIFSRTPDNRSTFVFRIPPIFKLLGEIEGLADQIKGIRKQARSTAGGDFDGDGTRDIAKMSPEGLQIFLTPKGSQGVKADFYEEYGDSKLFHDLFFGKKERDVTLDTIISFINDVVNSFQEAAIAGRKPSAVWPVDEATAKRGVKVSAHDLNGDGKDDAVIFLGPKNGKEFEGDEKQTLAFVIAR